LTKDKISNKISLNLSSSALEDINSITAWYEQQSIELGLKFITEIEFSLNKITNSPQAYGAYRNHISGRRYTMKVFPYVIFYHYISFHIEIIAVIHTSRSSRYIKGD
jgi:plasmid stabilization system protein ParE